MKALEISRTGLDVEWKRLEVIAENLANIGTLRTATGEAYRPQRLVSGPRGAFQHLVGESPAEAAGVMVYGVEPQDVAPRRVYEPAHPQADLDGFVSYPGVDQAGEMSLMVKTARAYEANIVASAAARQMYAKALELGKR